MSEASSRVRANYRSGWSWLLVLSVLFVVGFIIFLSSPITLAEDVQPYFTRPVVPEIAGTTTVGQSFVASYPGLQQVSFLVGTNARVNTSPVTFELRDASTQRVLEQTTINPAGLSDNSYLTVQFEPIPDSAGKAYFAWLAAPSAPTGQGITVWADPQPTLSQGRAYIGASPQESELTFRVSYHLMGYQLLTSLVGRLAAGKPGPWGWPGTYLSLAALYLVAIGVVIRWSLPAWPDTLS
ncbi:MAG TPA: hypothetical protein VNG11_06120 [Chloroflexota bacterium]|nr:hypothetical protein [Chloroflexota bacterium]